MFVHLDELNDFECNSLFGVNPVLFCRFKICLLFQIQARHFEETSQFSSVTSNLDRFEIL